MAVKFGIMKLFRISKELAIKHDAPVDSSKPVPDDASVAGQLNEAQKNLFTTLMQLAEKTDLLRVKHLYCVQAEEKANLLREKQSAESLMRLLRDIFWFEVNESFDLHGKSSGIATEWTVWYQNIPEEGECDCPACSLLSKFGLGSLLKDAGISF